MKATLIYLPGTKRNFGPTLYKLPKSSGEFSISKYLRMYILSFILTGLVVTWGFLMWGYIFR
ncbi:MAG TPA: hypothetical protein VGF30_10635 [Bacteroidia bacterium]